MPKRVNKQHCFFFQDSRICLFAFFPVLRKNSTRRNGKRSNGVTRNRVTGNFVFFLSAAVVNILKIITKIENEDEI